MKWIINHLPVFDIKTPVGELYLRRYTVLKLFGFKMMIHHILKPDYADHMHNHPWRFITIILKGGYKEKHLRGESIRKPFRIYYHGLRFAHVITELIDGEAWTMVIRGRRKRRWGFITECGWKYWKEYVNKVYQYLPICEEES